MGLGAGAAYYLSIMISQFSIGRPSSTWILGVFWLPILILKPGIIAFVVGWVLRIVLMRFYEQHEIYTHGIKILKLLFIVLIAGSIVAGTWKIYKQNEAGELKQKTTAYIRQGLTIGSTADRD